MMITPTATRPTIAMIVNGSRASARAGAARVRARTTTRVNARSRKLGWPTLTALGYRTSARSVHLPDQYRSVQIQQRDRAIVVLDDPLMRERDPSAIRRSYPPLLDSVGVDHPAVVARAERRAIDSRRG